MSKHIGKAVEHGVALVMGLWVAFSVITQNAGNGNSRIYAKLAPYVPVLPRWTFFGPRPGNTDTRVCYRLLLDNGEVTPYASIFFPEERHWRQMFFYPTRRTEKAINDVAQSIVKNTQIGPLAVAQSYEYQILRNYVELELAHQVEDIEQVKGFQFVLARDGGFDIEVTPEVLFTSKLEHIGSIGIQPVESHL